MNFYYPEPRRRSSLKFVGTELPHHGGQMLWQHPRVFPTSLLVTVPFRWPAYYSNHRHSHQQARGHRCCWQPHPGARLPCGGHLVPGGGESPPLCQVSPPRPIPSLSGTAALWPVGVFESLLSAVTLSLNSHSTWKPCAFVSSSFSSPSSFSCVSLSSSSSCASLCLTSWSCSLLRWSPPVTALTAGSLHPFHVSYSLE